MPERRRGEGLGHRRAIGWGLSEHAKQPCWRRPKTTRFMDCHAALMDARRREIVRLVVACAVGASTAVPHVGDTGSVHVPSTRMRGVPPHPTLSALDTATCSLDGLPVPRAGMARVVDVGEGVAG